MINFNKNNEKYVKFKNLVINIATFILIFFILSILLTIVCRDSKHFNGIDPKVDQFLPFAIFNRCYYLLTTLTTIGYGDISPASFRAKLFIMVTITVVIVFILKALDNLQSVVSNQINTVNDKIKTIIK